MVVFVCQFGLYEQIHCSPDRVQQAGEREIEELEPEILRRGGGHDPFDRPIAVLDLPTIAVPREVPASPIRHEHRILPVIIVFRVLSLAVDHRRLVPLVLAEVELPAGLAAALTPLKQPLRLGFLAGLYPLRDDAGKSALADHLQNVLTIELPIHQDVIDVNELFGGVKQILNDFQSCIPNLNYANGTKRTNSLAESWASCPNHRSEPVRTSDSSPASEVRSYNGVESYAGHSVCERREICRKMVRRDL